MWGAGDFGSISAVAGLALVALGLPYIAARGSIRATPVSLHISAAFVAWSWLSLLWSLDPITTFNRAATYIELLGVSWILWQLIRSRRDVHHLVAAVVFGAFVAAAGTYIAYLRSELYLEEGRYSATGFDPNDLGVTLAIGLPLAAYLSTQLTGPARWLGISYYPFAVGGAILTGSRGAFLATFTGIATTSFYFRSLRVRNRVLVAATAMAAGILLWDLAPRATLERLWTIRDELRGGSFTHRKDIWRAGLHLLEENPAGGVGAGAFAFAVEPLFGNRAVAHNTFLGVAAEVGLIGAGLFFAPFGILVSKCRTAPVAWRIMIASMFMTWSVGVFSLTWDYRKLTWLLLTIAVCGTGAKWSGAKRSADSSESSSAGL